MLFVAIENQNSAQKSRCCQPKLLAIADVDWTEKKLYRKIKKRLLTDSLVVKFALRLSRCAKRSRKTSSGAIPLERGKLLHGAAIEHVEHGRIGRAASRAIIAHKVVDAHARPGRSSRCRRRRPAISARRRWLQDTVCLRRSVVVGRRRSTGGGGCLGMRR
jgi:hypothetical protein